MRFLCYIFNFLIVLLGILKRNGFGNKNIFIVNKKIASDWNNVYANANPKPQSKTLNLTNPILQEIFCVRICAGPP